MFQGVFAEVGRAMIQERVRPGLRRATAQGIKSGKPIDRPKIEATTETAIRTALVKGDRGIEWRGPPTRLR